MKVKILFSFIKIVSNMNYTDKSKQSTCWPKPSCFTSKNEGSASVLLGNNARPVQRRALSNRELH